MNETPLDPQDSPMESWTFNLGFPHNRLLKELRKKEAGHKPKTIECWFKRDQTHIRVDVGTIDERQSREALYDC